VFVVNAVDKAEFGLHELQVMNDDEVTEEEKLCLRVKNQTLSRTR